MKNITMTRKELKNKRIWNREDKINYIRSYIESDDKLMLEIGPSIAPLWEKKDYSKVHYLESCDAEGLRERAKLKNKKSPIEKVDYVFSPELGFEGSIKNSSGYQYLSSSHVIEHIPDFIGHLSSVESISNKDGYYFCIIPDKNLIFDKYRPCSTLGHMVSHHVENRSALGAAIDSIFYAVEKKEGAGGWWNSNDDYDLTLRGAREALGKVSLEKLRAGEFPERGGKQKNSIAHSDNWFGHYHVFEPLHFAELIYGLRQLKLISLSLCDIVTTGHMDFMAILKNDNGKTHLRVDKVLERLNEQNYPFVDKSRVF